ncbi:MAG TPA: PDZ domain-containing protein [Pirellulales bacterium]|jgi:S1-C subfamily serine protease|nr:PDZ domain-containing protein [Pirellulales bacterium]
MKGALHKLELQRADFAEQQTSDRERLHDLAVEILDLRHKLMVSAVGLSLSPARSQCVVGRVSAGSPAGKAGIAVGDVVLNINGEALPENDGHLEEAIPRYLGQPQATFELRRGARVVTASVDLESLFGESKDP